MEALQAFSLAGKVALVTGAASGIGLECARVLGAAGARVMMGDVDHSGCAAAAAALRAAGLDVQARVQDVTAEGDWQASIEATLAAFGGLDVLVNNAGIYQGGTLESNTLEEVRRVHRVNVDSVFLGMKFAAQAMKPGGAAGRGGAIINLSSVAGLRGFSGLSAYCGSKGAVKLLTKAAAVEFGFMNYGIRVNSIHPGLIPTDMGNAVLKGFVAAGLGKDAATVQQAFERGTPLGMKGAPSDIAKAALFLASDQSPWVTGAELVVDGGTTAT